MLITLHGTFDKKICIYPTQAPHQIIIDGTPIFEKEPGKKEGRKPTKHNLSLPGTVRHEIGAV